MVKNYAEDPEKRMIKLKDPDECVMCGADTLYSKTDHIDNRLGYVEGAGQLCLDCYDDIYIKNKTVIQTNKRRKS